jgi:hypothetical protein
LLDLYSGCGAMSTGLCLGANLSGLNLVTVSSIILLSHLKILSLLDFSTFALFIYLFFPQLVG